MSEKNSVIGSGKQHRKWWPGFVILALGILGLTVLTYTDRESYTEADLKAQHISSVCYGIKKANAQQLRECAKAVRDAEIEKIYESIVPLGDRKRSYSEAFQKCIESEQGT
jgi:hypothetical protein